ncbi:MAG TPA: cation:proton antiporter [Candidatus Aminicenantes bacterium]|nr:cation:proton antiporter [Candidatus Aminicenantes bacterium]HRY65297.1 cation:proton antiporter [Candidatus Aminicenantes bacterium]HRZ72235.1 cation:proton antiporter [Candidatus Aminicenantes bacterium]
MPLSVTGELVIVLAVSVLIVTLSQKLRLPPVVGLLLTGVLIGPGGYSLVKNTGTVDLMAEIGVVMLLFTVGLEFEPARLKRIQRDFWLGGGLQVLVTTAAAVILLVSLRVPFREALFYGFLVSLSSTAVVLKIQADRGETDSPQGRVALGVLIFQDLAVVPMIAVVPILANAGRVSLGSIGLRLGMSVLAIAAAFLLARFLMPWLLQLVVRLRNHEVFLLATLVIVLGMAWLTSSLGLSLALGAFLAGVILAESDYCHQVVSDILPFKILFNSLFFISVGMLLDVGAAWRFRTIVLVLVAAVLIVKFAVIVLTVGLLGYGSRIAVLSGLALAQVGEFSFVLAGVGRSNGFLTGDVFQVFVASSILTIMATPFLIQAGPALAGRGEKDLRWRRRTVDDEARRGCDLAGHVIIAGYGLNGRNLAHVLKESGIGYFIIELNPVTVREARRAGESVVFGDVSSRVILEEAGARRAKGIVFAISDPAMTRHGVRAARMLNPDMFIIVRTRYATETDDLLKLGADAVIPEEFETSIEIFTRVLEKFHIPRNVIDAQVKVLRGECYGMLRGSCSAVRPVAERIADLLAAGTAETYFVGGGSWPAGKTLGAIDLRGRTGATVLAVVRGEESFTSPGADFEIREQDTLVLVADHRDIDRAFQYLTTGGPAPAAPPGPGKGSAGA